MKRILPLLLLLGSLSAVGQIRFEKGYFISSNGVRTNVLIKNIGWKDNPQSFTYKLDEEGSEMQGSLNNIREFGIPDTFKYVATEVPIDQSSDDLRLLSNEGRPLHEERKVFLKVLIQGDGTLYSFKDENREQFFFQIGNDAIKPLIFKRFVQTGSNKIRRNNQFQQQLWNELKCRGIEKEDIVGLEYGRRDLSEFFRDFNTCRNAGYEDFLKVEKERDALNLSLRTGAAFNSLEVNTYGRVHRQVRFGTKASLRLGIELEYILPFYRNKLSFLVEPTYQSFEGEGPFGEGSLRVTYHSLEIPLMVRHYFFLNDKIKAFVNAGYTIDLDLEGSEFDFETNLNAYTDFEIHTYYTNPTIGGGINIFNRYSLEVRYGMDRELTDQFMNWGSSYNSLSLILGYNFL